MRRPVDDARPSPAALQGSARLHRLKRIYCPLRLLHLRVRRRRGRGLRCTTFTKMYFRFPAAASAGRSGASGSHQPAMDGEGDRREIRGRRAASTTAYSKSTLATRLGNTSAVYASQVRASSSSHLRHPPSPVFLDEPVLGLSNASATTIPPPTATAAASKAEIHLRARAISL